MMNIDLSKCIDTILYIVGMRENGEIFFCWPDGTPMERPINKLKQQEIVNEGSN